MTANFVASVFIATSLDGFIAGENGELDWLTDENDTLGETGYDEFFASVDALVIGRKTFETVLGFGEWPYAGKRVLVLSRTLGADGGPGAAGTPVAPNTTVHADLDGVVATLEREGVKRVYVDGGQTIRAFLARGLISEMTLTRAPVLLGRGTPLFGPLDERIHLRLLATRELGAGFTQASYEVLSADQ
ncbi:dihydrofolate reductase family protein [Leifsonia kafniensis]|uniref:Dihydrofolate reductase family protein n=1 Tax=Leifsonia kafniensis TaxID=475957 RepID=A0ABP7L577_9MICO